MKQEVNLLTSAIRPRFRGLYAHHALVLVALVAIAAISLGVTREIQLRERALRGSSLDIEISNLTDDLAERSRFLAERNADPALLQTLQSREREAADKRRVLEALSGGSIGNTDGFSTSLEALARRFPEGAWLTRFRIADGGGELRIEGKALDPSLVPRLLQALEAEPAFAGTSIAHLRINRPEAASATTEFVFATGCLAGDAGDAGGADDAGNTDNAGDDADPCVGPLHPGVLQ